MDVCSEGRVHPPPSSFLLGVGTAWRWWPVSQTAVQSAPCGSQPRQEGPGPTLPQTSCGPSDSLDPSEPPYPHLQGAHLLRTTLTCAEGVTQAQEKRQNPGAQL